MNIIKKAKLKSRSLEVELDEKIQIEESTITNEVIKKCVSLAHDDLLAALDNLKKHMVKICDFKKSELITTQTIEEFDGDLLPDYTITGFSIGGNEDSEGVTLIGNRKFDNGKVLNIVTPFTKYDADEYEFALELAADIQRCVYEVEEYLNGKCAAKQLEIPFDDGESMSYNISDSEAGETVPAAKIVKSRKKKEEAA